MKELLNLRIVKEGDQGWLWINKACEYLVRMKITVQRLVYSLFNNMLITGLD